VASGFSRFDGESRPTHLPLTHVIETVEKVKKARLRMMLRYEETFNIENFEIRFFDSVVSRLPSIRSLQNEKRMDILNLLKFLS
jgi:hypothetical protein